ncbi:MAG: haloacid dehalogenase type II [Sphingomonadales bacterium]|nr:haloacid dehalogenase type II [Sphingomonadales bacterium]
MMGTDFAGIEMCVFDAYGTLFDFNSAVARHRTAVGPSAEALSEMWRTKQIQYTWLRNGMGTYAKFWQVTGEALDHCLATHRITDIAVREKLMGAYLALAPFPEAPGMLACLKRGGMRMAILSNGNPEMLGPMVAASGQAGAFEVVLSVDEVGVFKPDPRVYRLVDSDRWELVEAGLSDAQSEGFLELNAENRGGSRLVTEQGAGTVAVPLLPAGDVLGKLEKIDLVKIDVEGHEDAVFRSARDIFGARQPRAILFEEQKAQAGPNGPIGSLLGGIGYKVYGIGKTLTTTTLQPATDENAAHFNDFLAVSTGRTLPAKAKARYGL